MSLWMKILRMHWSKLNICKLMRVLVDTNILIDQVCQRQPFAENASQLLLLGYQHKIDLFFCPISFVNTVYVARKYGYNQESVIDALKSIASFCSFAEHLTEVVNNALSSGWKDFEDANQFFSAKAADVDCIVSRDRKGFESLDIPHYDIIDFLQRFV